MRYLVFAIISGWMSKGGYLNECTACNGASNQHNSSSAYFILANFLNLSRPAKKLFPRKRYPFSLIKIHFCSKCSQPMRPCSCSGNMDKIQVTQKVSGLSVNILVYLKSSRLKNFQVTHEKLKASWIVSKE